MSSSKSYIRTDEHGVMRVGDTRVPLDSVVYPFLDGVSAEEIQRDFESLTLEEVQGAIAYYLAHRQDVDEYLRQQEAEYDAMRAKSRETPSPVIERLRKIKKERAAQGDAR